MTKDRCSYKDMDPNVLAELLEEHTMGEAAEILGGSKGGLRYWVEKLGLKTLPRFSRTPRNRLRLREAALARYNYGGKEELVAILIELEKKLGRRPRI